jgi:hypothetical protein
MFDRLSMKDIFLKSSSKLMHLHAFGDSMFRGLAERNIYAGIQLPALLRTALVCTALLTI